MGREGATICAGGWKQSIRGCAREPSLTYYMIALTSRDDKAVDPPLARRLQ